MFNTQNIFHSIKSIVCLNGEIPKQEFFIQYPKIPLIACDGAGSRLIKQGLYPDLIVGDLDSLDRSIVPDTIEIIHTPDQNYTDFYKTLSILEEKKLFPCLVCGTTGKEIDHTLENINTILKYSQQNTILFHDSANSTGEKYGIFVFLSLEINVKVNSKISILPFPEAIVSSIGLKWDLEHSFLSQNVKSSVRNVAERSLVRMNVHQGTVLVLFEY